MNDLVTELRARLDSPEYAPIPVHTRTTILNYVLHRLPPGGAITALLSNDLTGFIGRADKDHQAALRQLTWILGYLPIGCQGSREKVNAWLAGRSFENRDGCDSCGMDRDTQDEKYCVECR